MLAQLRASVRARLGQFADVYMDAKIKITQKIADQIAGVNDLDKLMELRTALNNVMLDADDIARLDSKIKALISMFKTNATAFLAFRKEWGDGIRSTQNKH